MCGSFSYPFVFFPRVLPTRDCWGSQVLRLVHAKEGTVEEAFLHVAKPGGFLQGLIRPVPKAPVSVAKPEGKGHGNGKGRGNGKGGGNGTLCDYLLS